MARIAGIKTEKDRKGNLKSVTFDLKRHGARIMPVLIEMGAIDEDEFEKEWKQGITVEESRKRMYALIEEQWKNKS